jgi:hypothetical protein
VHDSNNNETTRRKLLRINALMFGLAGASQAPAFDMFCPRANIALTMPVPEKASARADINATASPGAPNSFPHRATDIGRISEDGPKISMQLVDCSSQEYHCKVVTFSGTREKPQEFLLVAPKDISPGREYTYRGVRMVTRLSGFSSPSNIAAAQVTLWQRIGDVDVPMELTIQPGRGVLFWDGVRFFPEKDDAGELCTLVSDYGIFRSTRVRLH